MTVSDANPFFQEFEVRACVRVCAWVRASLVLIINWLLACWVYLWIPTEEASVFQLPPAFSALYHAIRLPPFGGWRCSERWKGSTSCSSALRL